MVGFRVTQLKVGTMDNFVYLAVDAGSGEAFVVDSGWETKPILEAVKAQGAKVKFAVATHEHFDHTSTLRELADALGAEVVAHDSSPVKHDLGVADGQELKVGGGTVRVLHTPGHTEDSICLYGGTEVFTGDTLFVGTIGRFDERNAGTMYDSLHRVIMSLPDSTVVYSGHDYGEVPYRTLGEEKLSNPFLAAKDAGGFASTYG